MADFESTKVTLRFGGDDLRPQELTDRLGGTPTLARTKGESFSSKSGVRTAKTGQWHLSLNGEAPDDFETLVGRLLGGLTSDLGIWRDYSTRYAGDLFVGLFMGTSNDGLTIKPTAVDALGQRGLTLHCDVYSPATTAD